VEGERDPHVGTGISKSGLVAVRADLGDQVPG
jgi:hypothetical protein